MTDDIKINESTGSYTIPTTQKKIVYKLGEYNVTIKVNERNEFIGIENISVDKIFYTHNSVKAEHDVASFYED